MTLLLTAAFVLPLLWLMALLRGEVAGAYTAVVAYLAEGHTSLPSRIAQLPWVGDWLQQVVDQWARDPAVLRAQVGDWLEAGRGEILNVLGDVGRNAGKLGFALITLFFFYRDGESLLQQVRRVLRRFLGPRVEGYIAAVGGMTKAVVWGWWRPPWCRASSPAPDTGGRDWMRRCSWRDHRPCGDDSLRHAFRLGLDRSVAADERQDHRRRGPSAVGHPW
jgi:hypothetical protein